MAKADKLEVNKRVRQIMEWMLEGYLTNDIIKSCTSKWAIDERMAYKYIKKAKKLFTIKQIDEALNFCNIKKEDCKKIFKFLNKK